MSAVTAPGALRWLWLSAVVVGLDRVTKLLAEAHLDPYVPVPLLPSLNLTLAYNTGAAFSLLRDAGGWQRWLFVAFALAAAGLILQWLRQLEPGRAWLACALALVLGGALGNLWDRIMLGHVVDFVDVYYGAWHWPVFNLADSALSVGALMIVIDAVRDR